MTPLLRRLLPLTLVVALMVAGSAAPAVSAPSYRGVRDITFPVKGAVRYSDDFAAGRSGGRVHRATDLFGAPGTRIVAARGGTIIWLPTTQSGSAGFAIQILGDDGRTYAYYHLGPNGGRLSQAVARGLRAGTRVSRGQHIGYLGDSGNAAGGTPHLHFEIHDNSVQDPYGTNRVNPYASLRAAQGLSPTSGSSSRTSPSSPAPPPAAPVVSNDGSLRLGSRGRAVVRWQRKLNRSDRVRDVVADGAFGPGTHATTVAFQKSVGLGPAGLGVVGPRTRAAMAQVLRDRRLAARPPAAAPSTLLRLGDRGTAVVAWQQALNRTRRVGSVVADGDFGPATHRATVAFQKSVGLGPAGLGIVGPKSRAAMQRILR